VGEEPPRSAAKSLQTYVLRLRNSLEPDREGAARLLVTDGPGYRLAIGPEEVDANTFAQLVALSERSLVEGRPDAAAAALRDGLAMWRGPAYAGFEDTVFGQAEARRLEELRLTAIEQLLRLEWTSGKSQRS
jgi:DNA-binding SARP family transcriptional activator